MLLRVERWPCELLSAIWISWIECRGNETRVFMGHKSPAIFLSRRPQCFTQLHERSGFLHANGFVQALTSRHAGLDQHSSIAASALRHHASTITLLSRRSYFALG